MGNHVLSLAKRWDVGRWLIVACFCLGSCLIPAAAQPTEIPGLVGYWRFNGDFEDASGYGNHATNHGVTFAGAKLGEGAVFTNGAWMEIPDSPSLDLNDYTIEAWVKLVELSRAQNTVDKSGVGEDSLTNQNFGLGVHETNRAVQGFETGAAHEDQSVFSDDVSGYLGTFVHLAGTYNSSTRELHIYVNGVLRGYMTVSHYPPNTNDYPITVGKRVGNEEYFKGVIDELRIWNYARSQVEIEESMSQELIDQVPLRALAQARGLDIGTAVLGAEDPLNPMENDPLYSQVLGREFSMLTPENAMKFAELHQNGPEFDAAGLTRLDKIIDFAMAHNIKVRGHPLVWAADQYLPQWLKDKEDLSQYGPGSLFSRWLRRREYFVGVLRTHIQFLVGRYAGAVATWDVVNEAIDESGGLKDCIWLRCIGPDYIGLAFRWARQADGRARLFYNDFGAEAAGRKATVVSAWLRVLKWAAGVPIDGVGLQMHLKLDDAANNPTFPLFVRTNMSYLAASGFEVQITEMDVAIRTNGAPPTPEQLEEQAQVYRSILNACLKCSKCTGFSTWGFTDKYTWIPAHALEAGYEGYGSPLIYDAGYKEKPAYQEIAKELGGE